MTPYSFSFAAEKICLWNDFHHPINWNSRVNWKLMLIHTFYISLRLQSLSWFYFWWLFNFSISQFSILLLDTFLFDLLQFRLHLHRFFCYKAFRSWKSPKIESSTYHMSQRCESKKEKSAKISSTKKISANKAKKKSVEMSQLEKAVVDKSIGKMRLSERMEILKVNQEWKWEIFIQKPTAIEDEMLRVSCVLWLWQTENQ